jgi:chemosensory pili system protein ChpA (sensor histidine kinase/response regulator)
MADRRERELLLGIFLMEAWDTAGAIEEGLDRLTTSEAPTEDSLATLVVFAHRLKGSAGLHGFPGVSDLAAGTERLLERAPAASAEERARARVFLEGLVGLLKEIFDGISAVGIEDSARIAEFKSRHLAFFSPATPAARPEAGPAMVAPAAIPVSPLVADLRRFFAEGGEVLEYFLPEATEHLEAMTGALLAIEGGARDEETLATVFRAAHTL